MQLSEFKIGGEFFLSGKKWRCTDVGTRTVIAIQLDEREDQTWFNGPPYAVVEHVLDETSLGGCTLTIEEQ